MSDNAWHAGEALRWASLLGDRLYTGLADDKALTHETVRWLERLAAAPAAPAEDVAGLVEMLRSFTRGGLLAQKAADALTRLAADNAALREALAEAVEDYGLWTDEQMDRYAALARAKER